MSTKTVYMNISALASNQFKVYPLHIGKSVELILGDDLTLLVTRDNQETLKVKLVDSLNRKEADIGEIDYDLSPTDILERCALLVHQYMFPKVMKEYGIDDIFHPDHVYTEKTYERLITVLNKDNLIKIKTKDWAEWCMSLKTSLLQKYYDMEMFQNKKVFVEVV